MTENKIKFKKRGKKKKESWFAMCGFNELRL